MKIFTIKKYTKIVTLSMALGSMLVACDSFTNDLKPVSDVSDDYFRTQEEYEKALIGAYDMLQSTYLNTLTIVGASDDIILGGDPNTYDQPTLQRVDKMDHTPDDNNQLRDIWKFMYAAMGRANYILEFKDNIDFEGKDEIIAQAYFLRAYYAFELTKFFGDIPLVVEKRDGVDRIQDKRIRIGEQYNVNRVGSIAAVYALIEEDLKEAIPNLPDTQDMKYEISKGAAQALLGKVYLFHGTFDSRQYAKAAAQLNDVIDSEEYSLANLSTLFEKSGENGVESVFEVQYTSVEGAGWDCIQCSEGNYLPQNNAPRDHTGPKYTAGWGFSLPTQQLYDAYQAGDKRKAITILEPATSEYTPSRENTGYFSKKYLPTRANDGTRAGSDPLNWDNNYRAIRYADVLLMAAEAEVQSSGSVSNAIDHLNEVRARAFGDNSHDYPYNGESDLLGAIYNERRIELAGEGHRFFDLVRTGKAVIAFDVYNATKPADFGEVSYEENKNEVFPIPLVELELANAVTRWRQNQGY